MRASRSLVTLSVLYLSLIHQPQQTTCKSLGDIETPYYRYTLDNAVDLPNTDENDSNYWTKNAFSSLQEKLETSIITKKAKNLILFLGDGMSVPTIAAARIYLGQLEMKSGESSRLSFENFPYTGYSKTYCVDKQVADSACTSTAYTGGVKANYGTLGVTAAVARGNCTASLDASTHVESILSWAQAAGKGTGLVSTASITDASPAGAYSHSADRDWQSDKDLRDAGVDPSSCADIAQQLVRSKPGSELKVILGGGRKKFLPVTEKDKSGNNGERLDKLNLIQEWLDDKVHRKAKAKYVEDRQGLLEANTSSADYILGLFRPENMNYFLEPAAEGQPTLEEMTRVAIERLQKEPNGYYLFVEGALIDKAHHKNWAQRALAETVEFAKAIKLAEDMTSKEDTLIVVTADHAHTMSFSGYPRRGNNILSTTPDKEMNFSYSTLGYMNGPSAHNFQDSHHHDFGKENMMQHDYQFPSLFQLKDETHGGDDVAVYARGPWSHLFVGTYEQHLIPHIMAYAARIGSAAKAVSAVGLSSTFTPSIILLSISTILLSLRNL